MNVVITKTERSIISKNMTQGKKKQPNLSRPREKMAETRPSRGEIKKILGRSQYTCNECFLPSTLAFMHKTNSPPPPVVRREIPSNARRYDTGVLI